MRILVTGITGFVGGHLAEALLARGERCVVGLSRGRAGGTGPSGNLSPLAGRVRLVDCDLCDGARVEAVLREVRPDAIFHLAGYASAGRSYAEVDAAWEGNLTATRGLYEAVIRWKGRPRILFVGTGQVYGEGGARELPLHEDSPLRPSSPYAASKAAADLASYQYSRTHGLDIIRARPFNHIGPRQSTDYAVPSFARQVAAIARGRQPPVLEAGNLSSRRNLTDVRDVVEAYALLMEHGEPGAAYNIAGGQEWTMREVLDRLLSLAGVEAEVRQRADLVRPADPPTPPVDVSRLRRATGWAPRHSLEQTLSDTLAYWSKLDQQAHETRTPEPAL